MTIPRLGPLGRPLLTAIASLCLGWIAACATSLPTPVDVREVEEQRAILREFSARRARVRDIGYQIRFIGRRLCGQVLLPDAGLVLGEPGSRDGSDLEPILTAALDLRPGVNVIHVASAAPLAKAGLHSGDVLVAIDGVAVNGTDAYGDRLSSLTGGETTFTFDRAGRPFEVRTVVPLCCGIPVMVSNDLGLMTFQQGDRVAVPFGLIELASDDDLAIAIAHQIAHALIAFASEPVEDPEAAADQLGLLLAAESGFDVSRAPAFWTWLASEDPSRILSDGSFRTPRPDPRRVGAEGLYRTDQLHVGIARRLPAIRAYVEEILRVQPRRSR